MTLLLVNPPYRRTAPYVGDQVDPPTQLALLAALARQRGHPVDIFDMAPLESAWDDLDATLRAHSPRVVGIHNHAAASLDITGTVARRVREVCPGATVLVGGPNASHMPRHVLAACAAVDAVVAGEGEVTLPESLDALGGGGGLDDVPGVVFRRDGEIVANVARPLIPSLDQNPLPALDLLPCATYVSRNERYVIETIRGCRFKCQFCASALPGCFGRERFRSIDAVMAELEMAVKGYGFKLVFFVDNCFTSDRQRAAALCEAIIKSGLRFEWMAMGRVDSVDLELLRLMKAAGCWVMGYGVESASTHILDSVNKRTDLDTIRDAFRWTREAGITSQAFIILGLPEDTRQSLMGNLRFLAECRPDEVGVHALIPLPGTPYFDHPERYGLQITRDLTRYSLFDIPKAATKYLSRDDIIEYVILYNYIYRDQRPFDLESPRPRRKRDLPYIAFETGAIFYNPHLPLEDRVADVYRCCFELDQVAFEVFLCCDGYHTVPQMVSRVERLFDLPGEEASRRVAGVLREFMDARLLEWDGPAPRQNHLSGLRHPSVAGPNPVERGCT